MRFKDQKAKFQGKDFWATDQTRITRIGKWNRRKQRAQSGDRAHVSVKSVLAEEAVAGEVGDGVGVAGEFFLGEDVEFIFGQHTAVPSAVDMAGDVVQIYGEFGTVLMAELAGFDFVQEILKSFSGLV